MPSYESSGSDFPQASDFEMPYLRNVDFLPDFAPTVQFDSNPQLFPSSGSPGSADDFMWGLTEVGVQEPLPPQDTVEELWVLPPPPIHFQDAKHHAEPGSTLKRYILQMM